jgi:thiamine biosynthesis lipoprotein
MDTVLSPRRRRLLLGIGATALAGCSRTESTGARIAFAGLTMGSSYSVRAAAPARDAALLQAVVQGALDTVEASMSMFLAESELSRLNRAVPGMAVELSPELLSVLVAATKVSAASDGAFDVTVAPAVERWGFGTQATRRVPAPTEVAVDRARIDWRALEIDATRGRVVKHAPLTVDLGGIAKGYGVDRAAAALEAAGVRDYMIEVGGEVRARGTNVHGQPWRIGIEEPDALPQRARWVVGLAGAAMATSGDYRNYFVEGGRRYSHEIDPASAAPVAHALASVTVVDADTMRADALATALMVLGPERGRALAERLALAVQFVVRRAGGGFTDAMTPRFAALRPERV